MRLFTEIRREGVRMNLGSKVLGLGVILTSLPTAAVEISEVEYEGRPQFLIRTESATWYYDRAGGGFSGLLDQAGRDWIAFHREPLAQFPASAAAGYRGIPNSVFVGPDKGAGHPGFDKCRSELAGHATIRTTSVSGEWEWTWTFSERSATFSMMRADPQHAWWFLYEGPLAGSFSPREKVWGTDRGGPRRDVPDSRNQLFENWQWVYFGEPGRQPVLFVAQHDEDELADTLWYLGSSDGGAATAPDGMVVFGFGRGPGTAPLLRGTGHRFTVGFVDQSPGTPTAHALLAKEIKARVAASQVE